MHTICNQTTKMGLKAWIWMGFVLVGFCGANGKATPKITCQDDTMTVELTGPNLLDAYLKGLKNYPEPACLPHRTENSLRFRLSLNSDEFARCGTSQILNKITGSLTFYNRIIVIDREGKDAEILVKCKQEGQLSSTKEVRDNHISVNGTLRRRRDVLPAGFEEQNPTYGYDKVSYAPDPILTMVVKQEGRTIGQELLVQPGAPLTMEVSHIEVPSPKNDGRNGQAGNGQNVYDIIVSRLDVTDTEDQSEVILVNGCSVDSYLFENFANLGDTLSAKFRAFKFPDSSYVLFQGTVNVCLGPCRPSQCSNGQTGYGRRRRSLISNKMGSSEDNGNANDLYQFRINTLLRFDNSDGGGLDDTFVLFGGRRLNLDNYRLTGNGDILALSRSSGASGSGSVILSLLLSIVVKIWNLS